MTANTVLKITELDFSSIKKNLLDFLRSQSEFTDYDFSGSGLNMLLDVLAYNTHYNAYYVNMVANEMFLDTAQLRDSVLSQAKLLGYLPTSKTGAVASINVKVTPSSGNTLSYLTMPKNTPFISGAVDGINYNFLTLESKTVSKDVSNGFFLFSNVQIKEGESSSYSFPVNSLNPKRRFIIPSQSIDTSTLTVSVQESVSNSDTTVYTLNEDITALDANSTAYFLEESATGTYTVYFGDGYIGKNLNDGNIVTLSYLETNGKKSNKANGFTAMGTIGGFSNVSVTVNSAASSGSEEETIEQIRFRAPVSYTAQNRAVTKKDYEILLLKDYPNIDAISIWGGEDNDPPIYGKVFISIKPKEGFNITLSEKERIKRDILQKRSVLTVTPEILDPEYTYLKISSSVRYNPAKTNKTEDAIKQIVRDVFFNYADTDLKEFGSVFRESKLHRLVDESEKSILSNSIVTFLQKRILLDLNTTKNYTIKFENKLKKYSFPLKFYTYPAIGIKDKNGVTREIYFEEVPESYSGIDSINIINPGTDYTVPPTISITGDGIGASATAKITNGKLSSIVVDSPGNSYTIAIVSVLGGNGFGGTAKAQLSYRNGILRTYYYKSNGEKVVINENAGKINYDTGEILISSFTPIFISNNSIYPTNIFTINVLPDAQTLTPQKNKLLFLDSSDPTSVQVELIQENS